MVARGVPRGGDDPHARCHLMVAVDGRELDARREGPVRHRVEPLGGRGHLRLLHEDRTISEAVVLAAVVEVEVGGDDRRDVVDTDAVDGQGVIEVVVDRPSRGRR